MKTEYLVSAGVAEINGLPVPKDRRMMLTDAQALYDLAHGRLTRLPRRRRTRPKAPK